VSAYRSGTGATGVALAGQRLTDGFADFEGFGDSGLWVFPKTRMNTRSAFSLVFQAYSPFLRVLRVFTLSVVWKMFV
jgi:hypothetical protein